MPVRRHGAQRQLGSVEKGPHLPTVRQILPAEIVGRLRFRGQREEFVVQCLFDGVEMHMIPHGVYTL